MIKIHRAEFFILSVGFRGGKNMRIIVVEDEERSRRGIAALISSFGDEYDVIAQATNGKHAFDLICKLKPDVVFTDIQMPLMNGLELIEAVHKMGITPQFVIISAHEDFTFAKKAISLGVREYILKPITIEDIENALAGLKRSETTIIAHNKTDVMHPIVRRAIAEIETGFAKKITLEQIAAQYKVTPEYFSYIFARDAGKNFNSFLNHIRIEAAKTLLKSGQEKIADVAGKVGFTDAKYFCKVFKKKTGQTPSEYMHL